MAPNQKTASMAVPSEPLMPTQKDSQQLTGFKIDDSTHIIRNIVYMRDPHDLEPGTNYMNQSEAFSH